MTALVSLRARSSRAGITNGAGTAISARSGPMGSSAMDLKVGSPKTQVALGFTTQTSPLKW